MNKSVTLYLPNLQMTDFAANEGPLALILSKANKIDRESVAHPYQNFFQGLDGAVPAAALLADYLGESRTASYCLASPIECHVDQKTAYFVQRVTQLSEADENTLLEKLNHFLAEDGIALRRADKGIWLFALTHHTDVHFHDPATLVGKSLASYLPTGKDAVYWHRLLTECQMLLVEYGLSVWFWGNANPTKLKTDYDALYTDDLILKALAKSVGIIAKPLPTAWEPMLLQNTNELFIEPPHDLMAPLLSALRQGKIKSLKLITEQKEYMLKRRHLYYFWRSKRISNDSTTVSKN
ncbi:hypothetical protein [Candidatus Berkiella aquae]|uniref:Uncharacterized protein n=1 Tax=Candidatus Berkiella aquae TaxID=295108 RepID=A0A0Q9YX29_9GAMM|nr:hypothetical protein [Candidatus Berkiella aquae]MCS5711062.1 hypothetical protein [Candidatus Berkiella aquae]